MRMLKQQGFVITYISGWRLYLGTAQHNYPHWTRVFLPPGRLHMDKLEGIPGVLPFEVYSQAPLRLISWYSFELPQAARRLLRELAVMCETPATTTQKLIAKIAQRVRKFKRNKIQANILRHWPRSALRPEPSCLTTRLWSSNSLALSSCQWPYTC